MPHYVHPDLLCARHLRGIANAAAEIIQGAQQMYACGLWGQTFRDHLEAVHYDLIRLLALHEDGAGYGVIPADLRLYLRRLEQVACDLIVAGDAFDAEAQSANGSSDRGN